MKKFLFAAALVAGSAAFAQSGETVSDPSQSTGPRGITQQGTDPDGQAVAPPGTNQPVNAPPGARVIPADNQAAAFATRPATTEYPPCSKTVTDGCVQTYEKGVRRPR
jgi:hypothetical protein